VKATRHSAQLDGDFVVFLIGMRPNRPWKLHRWVPVVLAMRRMLAELSAHPEKGLLGYEQALIGGPAVVQYWRSLEHLDRFSHDQDDLHVPAWRNWNRRVRDTRDVGVWHETYQVRAGAYESVYVNMPLLGLAAAAQPESTDPRTSTGHRRIQAQSS
jgi:Domain of unknown function (DUF4188)